MRTVWEFSVRSDFRGRGISQEFRLLDVNGERLTGWLSESNQGADTLPKFLKLTGKDGWEMVSHAVNQDVQANGVTWHYTQFKCPKL